MKRQQIYKVCEQLRQEIQRQLGKYLIRENLIEEAVKWSRNWGKLCWFITAMTGPGYGLAEKTLLDGETVWHITQTWNKSNSGYRKATGFEGKEAFCQNDEKFYCAGELQDPGNIRTIFGLYWCCGIIDTVIMGTVDIFLLGVSWFLLGWLWDMLLPSLPPLLLGWIWLVVGWLVFVFVCFMVPFQAVDTGQPAENW